MPVVTLVPVTTLHFFQFLQPGGPPTERPPKAAKRPKPPTPARASYAETSLETRIGQGTYGSVFRGRCGDVEVAVKVMALQADTAEDIKREIKILQNLCGGPNIINLLDIVRDPVSKTPSLVFEHVDNEDFKTL